jgi:hypothetical protein
MMIAALILVFSVAALVQFAVSQWRSMWIVMSEQPLSASIHTATGLSPNAIGPDDFELLARTTEQMFPSAGTQRAWLREVGLYYSVLCVVQSLAAERLPDLAGWVRTELVACSRYAGVVLDQALSANLAYAAASRNG